LLAYSLSNEMQRHLLLGEMMTAESVQARLDELNARHPQVQQNSLDELR